MKWSVMGLLFGCLLISGAGAAEDPLSAVRSQAQGYASSLARHGIGALESAQRQTLDTAATLLFQRHKCAQALDLRKLAIAGNRHKGFDDWLPLAQAALCAKRWDDAVGAAWLAQETAPDPQRRRQALVLLGSGLEAHWRYGTRQALVAYRQALELDADPQLQKTVERLAQEVREADALHVDRHFVQRERGLPAICLDFNRSMPEPEQQRYGDYIRFEPPFQAQFGKGARDQVCAGGAAFGTSYRVHLLKGLKGADGEALVQTQQIEVDTGDRPPALWFENSRYVLPRGEAGVPLHSVNVARVHLTLYRIGGRNLLNDFVQHNFRTDLAEWGLRRVRDQLGEQVWEGEAELAPQRNRESLTNLPVSTLAKPVPGVYLLSAASTAKPEADESAPSPAVQWLVVSDIGITSYRGTDGLTVVVRSLASARPLHSVRVSLYARNNRLLGEQVSPGSGVVHFPAALLSGSGGREPQLLLASGPGEDFNFFDIGTAPFDLSDRGVAGRPVPGPLDAFLYTERGVYRPGGQVHLGALLRNDQGRAVDGLPLTLRLLRPDEQLADERVIRPQGAGGYAETLKLSAAARTGRWKLQAFVDPKAEPIGETAFQVESIVPPRIEVELTRQPTGYLLPDKEASFAVAARYLFGAPAADLAARGEVLVAADPDPFPDFPGFRFGSLDEPDDTVLLPLPAARTDADGLAAFAFRIDRLPDLHRPLRARLRAEVADVDGRTVAAAAWLPLRSQPLYIGLKAPQETLADGAEVAFEALVLDRDGRPLARPGLAYRLLEEEVSYQWYRENGRWQYKRQVRDHLVRGGALDAGANGRARLALPLPSGRYRLELEDGSSGVLGSARVEVGWIGQAADAETPDVIDTGLDQAVYRPGQTAHIRLRAPFAGFANLVIAGDRVLEVREIELSDREQVLEVPVQADWGAGAYALITAYRPEGGQAGHGPRRAIGVAWIGLDKADHALTLKLETPERSRPRRELRVPLRVGGQAPGSPVFVTLAAVDEGVLQLTGYRTPDPLGHYFGQRRLGVGLRDLYGRLIDGNKGRPGRIRSGGGASGRQGMPDSHIRIVALYSGVVTLDGDGRAEIPLALPDFNGRLRLTAVAWSPERVGSADAKVTVRDPVVVMPSLPRFLAAGDSSLATVLIRNMDGPEGGYRVAWQAGGALGLVQGAGETRLTLTRGKPELLTLPLRADAVGKGSLRITLEGPGETALEKVTGVGVRAPFLPETRRRFGLLGPGEALRIGPELAAGLRAATLSGAVSLSARPDLDVPGLLKELDLYPYGCLEQLTSRAFPLLHLNRLAQRWGYESRRPAGERLAAAVAQILEKQLDNGGFSMWNPAGHETSWLSVYALDFLQQAREAGVAVPEYRLQRGLRWLRRQVEYPQTENPGTLAVQTYALYLLARAGEDQGESARYLLDEAGTRLPGPLAAAQLGAALEIMGDRERARRAFDLARKLKREDDLQDYGSPLRDRAALALLVSEHPQTAGDPAQLVQELAGEMAEKPWLSTQEQAWLVRAADALTGEGGEMRLRVQGNPLPPRSQPLVLRPGPDSLNEGLALANAGEQPVWYSASVSGSPLEPPTPLQAGLTIRRRLLNLQGEPVDLEKVQQGEVILVLLEGEVKTKHLKHQALIVDPLPAGLEVESPGLAQVRSVSDLGWVGELSTTQYSDALDDRFVAALDLASDQHEFRVAYLARAVTPGSYRLAPPQVEDMYKPRFRGRGESGWLTVVPGK